MRALSVVSVPLVYLASTLCALASLAILPARAQAEPDARIVGYWVLQKPGVINPSQTLVEFHADATYTIHDAANGQTGTYVAAEGRWSLASQTSTWRDRGTYSLNAAGDVLTLAGMFGVGKWSRYRELPYFSTVTLDGLQVPQNVGAALARAWIEVARRWQEDAVPVGTLEVAQLPRSGEFSIVVRFRSQSTGTGMTMTMNKFERTTNVYDGSRMSRQIMPLQFVDLPRVVELMKGEGRAGPFTRFELSDHDAGWGWSAWMGGANNDKVTWVTVDGRISHKDDTTYINQYNMDMEAAARAITALLANRTKATGVYAAYSCAQDDDECVFYRQMSDTMCMLARSPDPKQAPCTMYVGP